MLPALAALAVLAGIILVMVVNRRRPATGPLASRRTRARHDDVIAVWVPVIHAASTDCAGSDAGAGCDGGGGGG